MSATMTAEFFTDTLIKTIWRGRITMARALKCRLPASYNIGVPAKAGATVLD